MPITHKIFLYWLLYLSLVGFSIAVMALLGLPQLAFEHDKSYLSLSLVAMYLVAEVLAGKQAIWVSKQHRSLSDVCDWLRNNDLVSIEFKQDESAILRANGSDCKVMTGPFADLLKGLVDTRSNGPKGKIDQGDLIDAFAEHLDRRISMGDFIASRIVWVGILATIVGVIMAFWPFQQAGMTIDAMRANLGAFFSGVAVAFIPTAVSFVFKITLDFNTKILQNGISEIIEMATTISASCIVPKLEKGSIKV